jgi:methyl-accepting chemotaxis protein
MLKEQSAKDAAKAMISGETGYKAFNMGNTDFLVFYKPFKRIAVPGRTSEDLGWSAGIVYPEDDIFGDYNDLTYYVLGIVIIGLLLSFIISSVFIHRQMKPLIMLTRQAQRIAEGNLDEPIPDSHREDEIGRLQGNFKLMQQSLAINIGELEQLTTKLKEHGEELSKAYKQAQKADRMKTAFLHNMTNQMLEPSEAISRDVATLCGSSGKSAQDTAQLADDIQKNGTTITELLKNLLNMSDEDFRKEAQDA